ncbi:hypothetical protein [Streptomyces sp. NBC_00690]|uniref:hypothetical protein n=1 Tax=Streptomyces sp. NBC_00690 TaxID=2975808 RepID=UPI002E2C6BD4|nr:hypothetical protein [Streptomyces sp. NBC_00690]
MPSAKTVQALATALRLPADELLELRWTADAARTEEGPGRPVKEWEPHDLEVHPAGYSTLAPDSTGAGMRVLPGYVRRAHGQVLESAARDAAAGRSGIVVLVGSSSTGETRACWEAVQPLAGHGWQLWHPFDPTRPRPPWTNCTGSGRERSCG